MAARYRESFYTLRLNRYLLSVALVVAVAVCGRAIAGRLLYTGTPSLSHRIFFVQSPTGLKKEDFVVFNLHGDRFVGDEERLLKKVVCAEGDILEVKDREYYCNGVYLDRGKELTLKGARLDNFAYKGEISKGHFFVMGEHKDSYDSRYFGFIRKGQVVAKAYPVW